MADGTISTISTVRPLSRREEIRIRSDIAQRENERPCSLEDYGCDDVYRCFRHRAIQDHVDRVFARFERMRASGRVRA